MATYFSPSTGGFYVTEVHGSDVPGDAVEISAELHWQLIDGQSATQRITAGPDGVPFLANVPAPAPPVRPLSFAQLLIGLVAEGWITEAEGTAWLVNRALPQPVSDLIAQLPADQRFAATARAVAPSEVVRLDPLVVALGQAQGKTPEELDQFFDTYRQV